MNWQLKRVFYGECIFEIFGNVYEPAEDSLLLAENLEVAEGDVVLDVGTGCGLLAILAAKKTRKVVATDVNPEAIRCAKRNAVLNNVADKIDTQLGDLFEPLKLNEIFDVILFNAPYLPSEEEEERDVVSRAWAGGETGRKVIDRFIHEAPAHLKKNGRILLVQSTLSDTEQTIQMFAGKSLHPKVVAEKKLDFEAIIVIEARS